MGQPQLISYAKTKQKEEQTKKKQAPCSCLLGGEKRCGSEVNYWTAYLPFWTELSFRQQTKNWDQNMLFFFSLLNSHNNRYRQQGSDLLRLLVCSSRYRNICLISRLVAAAVNHIRPEWAAVAAAAELAASGSSKQTTHWSQPRCQDRIADKYVRCLPRERGQRAELVTRSYH